MLTLCQYADGHCSQCGRELNASLRRTCIAGPSKAMASTRETSCPHLGKSTGQIVLIKCEGCCGNVQKKHEVYACAVKGACLPKLTGMVKDTAGVEYRGCGGCDRQKHA